MSDEPDSPPTLTTGPCIFRVPQSLSEIIQNAYRPNKVAIGPYHHGNPQFVEMERHKRRFAEALVGRSGQYWREVAYTLQSKVETIKDCYSGTIVLEDEWGFGDERLIGMMVVDGCFIIELFLKYRDLADGTGQGHDDPLLTGSLALLILRGDLVKLENQIPWFVLEHLYNLTQRPLHASQPSSSLCDLALKFFNREQQRPEDFLNEKSDQKGLHLLNILRMTYVHGIQEPDGVRDGFLRLIKRASELNQVGIKFKPTHRDSFIHIEFNDGVLKIPVLKFDDFWRSLLLNFIAFEQCRGDSAHFTTYAIFMACLLNTPADAWFLCNRNIIESYYGTDETIVHFFRNIGKDVVFNISRNHLCTVFHDVNKYCEKDWRVEWASFKNTYFKTRWYILSAIAAFIILALTAIQSFYAVYAYYLPPH